jgi:murein hydrolase activator
MNKFFVALFTLLLFMSTIVSHAQTSRQELEKKKNKVENEISSLQKELEKTQKNKNATLQQVNALKKKIRDREKQINGYASQISSLDKGITQTKQQINTKQTRLQDLQSRYGSMVLYNYRHRNAYDRIMFVLSAHSFNEAFQRLRYLRRYSDYRKNQSGEIRVLITELTGKQK